VEEPTGADPGAITVDLVQYVIISLQEDVSLATVVPPLVGLVEQGVLRILDLVVLHKDRDGRVTVLELEEVEELSSLTGLEGEVGGLLSVHDIALAAAALPSGVIAAVLVSEDRWAEPLAAAVRDVGGTIVAGERIPASRVEAAIARLTGGVEGG
jgi:hypothetical protein